jgi:hypothetical protein
LCTTAGRCVINHEASHAAAPNDFFYMAVEAFPAFDRPLRRPQIRFVEDQMQRFLISFVKRLGKGGHETPACCAAAEIRQIDDADEYLAGDHPPERGAPSEVIGTSACRPPNTTTG